MQAQSKNPAAIVADETRTEEAHPSHGATVGYWVATLFVASTAVGAGLLDVLHREPLFGLLLHLGYPPYFSTVLGAWKVLGAVALIAPRYPLVKEWAYAGMAIDYTSAMISHAASGDAWTAQIGPMVALVALAGSWYLRPRSRRLEGTLPRAWMGGSPRP